MDHRILMYRAIGPGTYLLMSRRLLKHQGGWRVNLVTALIEAPGKFLSGTDHAMWAFLTGAAFNMLRILVSGLAAGFLYDRVVGDELLHK